MPPSDIFDHFCTIYVTLARLEEKVIVLGRDMKAKEEKTRSWLKWSIGTIISLVSLGVVIYSIAKII